MPVVAARGRMSASRLDFWIGWIASVVWYLILEVTLAIFTAELQTLTRIGRTMFTIVLLIFSAAFAQPGAEAQTGTCEVACFPPSLSTSHSGRSGEHCEYFIRGSTAAWSMSTQAVGGAEEMFGSDGSNVGKFPSRRLSLQRGNRVAGVHAGKRSSLWFRAGQATGSIGGRAPKSW